VDGAELDVEQSREVDRAEELEESEKDAKDEENVGSCFPGCEKGQSPSLLFVFRPPLRRKAA